MIKRAQEKMAIEDPTTKAGPEVVVILIIGAVQTIKAGPEVVVILTAGAVQTIKAGPEVVVEPAVKVGVEIMVIVIDMVIKTEAARTGADLDLVVIAVKEDSLVVNADSLVARAGPTASIDLGVMVIIGKVDLTVIATTASINSLVVNADSEANMDMADIKDSTDLEKCLK